MSERHAMLAWLRRNLFADWISALITLALLWFGVNLLVDLSDWALVNAVYRPDAEACHQLKHAGACWGMIAEKYPLILFGRYPHAEQWRALCAILILLALLLGSAHPRAWSRWLPLAWLVGLGACGLCLKGGFAGLTPVDSELWGGLPLTLLLTVAGIGGAFPLALLIAFGRRSSLAVVRILLTWYVELVRGIPLIPVLFLASFLFPLFLPAGVSIDVLLRVLAAIVLFAAAYLAEVIRGGLESIPAGQYEAALALGFGTWQAQRLIILPQALRAVVPSIMNSTIALFKDTSLVTVVSLFDLTGALSLALAGDAQWRPFYLEGYLLIGAIYWLGCFAMSRYSVWIENRLRVRG